MNNQKVFYIIISGFILGIFCSSFIKMGFSFFLLLIILSLCIFIFVKYLTKNKAELILFSLFIFSFGLGILRYEIKESKVEDKVLRSVINEKVNVQGIIISEPSKKEQGISFILASQNIKIQDRSQDISNKILISTSLFPELKYGDFIEIIGKLEKTKNFITDNGISFDNINYLAKDDIFYQISFAQTKIIEHNRGSFLKGILLNIKNIFVNKIDSLIKEPESALLNGLLLGAKNSLGTDLQISFRRAGVSHIVALSGYNITIVADSIMLALSFLPRLVSFSFGAVGILLFAVMTGGGATIMRASIMALLVLLAKISHRPYDIGRALLLAGVLMLIQNPKILVFDISFQLSFLATLALVFVSPLVERKMIFITTKYNLRELIVATISTQIFVLPFILYKMNMFTSFSLLTNILILPIIPIIMFLGFLIGSLSLISTVLTIPIAFICSLLLSYVLKVIDIFAYLPLSTFNINNFPLILVVGIYSGFAFVIWLLSENHSPSTNLN